jgi:hypothetical protein
VSSFPKPTLRGVMFVSVYEDGRMSVATLLDPETSGSEKWETLARVNVRNEDVETKQHEDLASTFGRQLAVQLGSMRETMLLTREVELADVEIERVRTTPAPVEYPKVCPVIGDLLRRWSPRQRVFRAQHYLVVGFDDGVYVLDPATAKGERSKAKGAVRENWHNLGEFGFSIVEPKA